MAKKRSKQAQKKKNEDSDEEGSRPTTPDMKYIKRGSVDRYDLEYLATCNIFSYPELLRSIQPEDFNEEYIIENGLTNPIVFSCPPEALGMKMPDPRSFSVDDVLKLVGGKREVEVVKVDEQGSATMSLQEIVDYYNSGNRSTLYNVLSLEFSTTPLIDVVSGPALVKEIDWVENHYPDVLKRRRTTISKNDHFSFDHSFPQVQNYCLMSVARCFTDFHIDFGGTSVWYHVLKGEKIFWLIEPTEYNIIMYNNFTKNYADSEFLGKTILGEGGKCHRVTLHAGQTAIIPSGWIHAVYTPADSLVFGGNFMHDYSAAMQTHITQLETKLTIRQKYRFPYFEELVFYLIADVVKECTGRAYLRPILVDDDFEYVGKEWIQNKGYMKPIDVEMLMSPKENVVAPAKADDQADTTSGSSKTVMIDYGGDDIFYDPPSPTEALKKKCKTTTHRQPFDTDDEPLVTYIQSSMNKINKRKVEQWEALYEYIRTKRTVDVPDFITRPSSLLLSFKNLLMTRRSQLEREGCKLEPAPPIFSKEERKLKGKKSVKNTPIKGKNGRKSGDSGRVSPVPSESDRSVELGMEEDEDLLPLAALIPKIQTVETFSNDGASTSEAPELPIIKEEAVTIKEETETVMNEAETLKDEAETVKEEDVSYEIKEEEPEKNEPEDDIVNDSESVCKENVDQHATCSAELKEEEHEDPDENGKENPMDNSVDSTIREEPPCQPNEEPKKEEGKKTRHLQQKRTPKSKPPPKRRSAFEEALSAPDKKKKKNDKKEKPQFVGGLPMAPIQDEPVVPNPYNYDPMAEILPLGKGQLQSAYRKSKQMIAPPSEKKFFKLEHKPSIDEPVEEDQQLITEVAVPTPIAPSPAPLQFTPRRSTFSTPSSVQKIERQQQPDDLLYYPTAPKEPERRNSTGGSARISVFADPVITQPTLPSPGFSSNVARGPSVDLPPPKENNNFGEVTHEEELTPLEMAALIDAERELLDELNKI